ncbi:outer membrane beta-barrel protein [Acidocella sp. KAb 2-4]|uniref:outer membrane beta-barrel protein n=1 Tax=Acidocella sp. KAb 2-4 TaxID=2885158 RepID=UPI001D08EEC0|nr:outer membrane beta-barrel protein [Acidocella sp. KAb 2-4]MCB5943778.1 outer membrane beta-barrel protein [Acidocella sp. KAb 2-4]
MRRHLLGLGFAAASSLLALNAAQAMTGPQAINIDGGPLGQLSLSGGVNGYGYVVSNQPNNLQTTGANIGDALIELQKNTGVLQFTIEVGSTSSQTLGALGSDRKGHIPNTSTNVFTTGPLYAGYITIAPQNSPVTVSVGQLASLEGYESLQAWNNPSQLTTALFYVENSQSRGVSASYANGPLSATVEFGDGVDSGVFNFLQALVSYQFNANNTLSVYYAGNLGRTGLNTYAYGGYTTGTFGNTVAAGAAYANNQMVGAYYSYTNGSLNLIPEVQYQLAKADHQIGIQKPTSTFGAAVLADYAFANTPYSLGGWVEYFNSHTSAADNASWFVGPDASAIGAALSPTWQYKDLYVRANAGYIYLLHHRDALGNEFGYGNTGTSRGQFTGTLEAGLLF